MQTFQGILWALACFAGIVLIVIVSGVFVDFFNEDYPNAIERFLVIAFQLVPLASWCSLTFFVSLKMMIATFMGDEKR